MTATDELRKMLGDRGVEYTTGDGEHVKETCWPYMGELIAAFAEYDNGTTRFACDTWCFTPAQAIAATLGADEYAIEHNVDGSYKCPKCGCVVDYDIRGDDERIITMDDYVIPFNFCPKCGAEVVCE